MQKPRIKHYPQYGGIYICGRFIGDNWETCTGNGWSPKEAYDDWVRLNGGRALINNWYNLTTFSDDLTLWQKIKRWWDNGTTRTSI